MATLIITQGPASGQSLALGEHRIILIGRDDDCTFQIIDEQMSRRHLQIKKRDDPEGHEAVDFGSTNGVVVNGQPIDAAMPLVDGDEIRIGATALVYAGADDPDAQAIDDLLRKRGEHRRNTILGNEAEA